MRRVGRSAGWRLGLLGPVVLLAGACGEDRVDASQADDDLPDCSAEACEAEVAAYADEVAALPVVRSVEMEYEARQITDGPSVSGEVRVTAGTDCADLGDDLGRLLWQSDVAPANAVTLLCFRPGASGADYEFADYAFVLEDAGELTARWGPRGG
jgi:hypothetical protein